MSRYSKNLTGQNAKVFVSAASAYTTDATFAAYLASSNEGKMGVYLSSGSLVTTALSPGDEFFVVQKRDGFAKQTPILKWNDLTDVRYVAYTAPVKQISTIGYNGTTGDLGFSFTLASSTNTLTYGISARETTPGNQPFPVQEGYATVNSSTADQYTVIASIVSQMNGDYDYERTQPDKFVSVDILSDGALTGLGQTAAVVNGSVSVTAGAAVTLADKSFLSLAAGIYRVNGTVTASTAIVLDRPYQGATATLSSGTTATTAATMAYTSGSNKLGVRLTSILFESHFRAVGNLGFGLAPVTLITSWKLGSGYSDNIIELEKHEGLTFDTGGSTINARFKEDYGQPSFFAIAGTTYDQIFVDFAPIIRPSASLPIYAQTQIERIQLVFPSSGTTPQTSLKAIFGV